MGSKLTVTRSLWPEGTGVIESHFNSNNKTMKKLFHLCVSKMGPISVGVALLVSLFSAQAAIDPMTVSAGDVNQTSTVLWAHSAVPGQVRLDFSTDPTFTTDVRSIHLREHDALVPVKALVTHLSPATTYETALMAAAAKSDLPLARFLPGRGANINAVGDGNMSTTLGWAAYNCDANVIRCLLEHGARLSISNGGVYALRVGLKLDKHYGAMLTGSAKLTETVATRHVKYWEIIADNLSKAGWSWGCVSAIDSSGRTIWILDAAGRKPMSLKVRPTGTHTPAPNACGLLAIPPR